MANPTAVKIPPRSRPDQAETPAPSDALLERLNRLHPKVIDLSLGRVERLLERLGHPERRLPPVVHVAGTNGKGSVIAFLRAMLEAVGHRVHVYTSPHLVRFHERIRLGGALVGEPDLAALLEECEAANGEDPITFFEITTAAAFLAFAREPADIVLLETGLGGRLDATNVVARPRLSVITPISIDHTQYLGETLAEIAFEKAGILKPAVPALIGPQAEAAGTVIARRARELDTPLTRAGAEWGFEPTDDGFRLDLAGGSQHYGRPALNGDYQLENAACAAAAAALLSEYRLDEEAIRRGLARVDWPGRLQHLQAGPLVRRLPPDWELWIDGGHNAAAGTALAHSAAGWSDHPLHVIYGMLNNKAAEDFLRPIAPHARSLSAVAIPGVQATLSASEAAARAQGAGATALAYDSLNAALAAILEAGEGERSGPGRVLICGSLYLAGHVLGANGGF